METRGKKSRREFDSTLSGTDFRKSATEIRWRGKSWRAAKGLGWGGGGWEETLTEKKIRENTEVRLDKIKGGGRRATV